MIPKITRMTLNEFTNYVLVSYYPYSNEIAHFNYQDRSKINKDKYMVGLWKLKKLKK